MMLSLYSGVSGLKAQEQKLNVIGNNISNISTVGYKAQTVSFSDMLSEMLSGATGPSSASGRGGTDPLQIGTGVTVASTSTNMSSGSPQSTGNNTDVSISGNGFFIVKGGGIGEYQFTRAGNFGVDVNGNLTVDGLLVCGWEQYTKDANGNYIYDTQKQVESLNLFSDSYNGNKKIIAPAATTAATITGNLDPSKAATGTALNNIGTVPSTPSASTTLKVYDAQGNGYDIQLKLYKCYTNGATDIPPNTTSYYWEADPSDPLSLNITGNSGYIRFDQNGNIVTTDPLYPPTPTINLTPQGTYKGAASFTVNLDMTGTSYYASSTNSGLSVSKIDGYPAGELEDFTIGSDGIIWGVYSNDQKQPLGMLGLATFTNPAGLEKIGSNLYAATVNSGTFTNGVAAGSGGAGTLNPGTLEMSNVDLSEQFTEMMIAQRAYQANSKIITASDNMLDSLINMIR